MRRRDFITLLGSAAAAWPLAARAQPKERRLGILMGFSANDADAQARLAAFRHKLAELGWTDSKNIRIEERWASGNLEQMQPSAADLIATSPDALLGVTVAAVQALHRETGTIPIVFTQVSDPIGSGLIENLARPGGNITGFTNFEASMGGKWLELLKEIAPGIKRAAFLFHPGTAAGGGAFYLSSFNSAAASLAIEPVALPVRDDAEITQSIDVFARQAPSGLMVMPDAFTLVHRDRIVHLATQYRLPAVYPFRFFGQIGGLLCYGIDAMEQFPKAAAYIDRILKGAKAGDLPVQQSSKFELVVNLKTAKALGLAIPGTMLARADEVIE